MTVLASPPSREAPSLETSRTLTTAPITGTRRPFLTPLSSPGHFLLVIDNSSLERWKRCAMAGRNYIVLGREAHGKDAALAYGGTNHVGLEWSLRQQFDPTITDEVVVQKMMSYWTENPAPDDGWRSLNRAVEVLGHYRKRCEMPDYKMEVLSDEHGPLIERAFELPLGVIEVNDWLELPTPWQKDFEGKIQPNTWSKQYVSHIHIAWSGRIDVLARCGPGLPSPARVVDHKTSQMDGDQYIQSFQLSSQTIGYVWAARQLWPDHSVSGFCLNVLRLKKPGKGQGITDRGARGGEPPLAFFRAYFDYSAERIEQWKVDTLNHISDLIHCVTRNAFPLNDRHCFDKFGKCAYYDACNIDDPIVRERFLQSDAYAPVTWSPTAER